MAEPLRLYGLKALVTSGASGIGEAVARTLAKHGASVLAVDARNSRIEQMYKRVKGVEGAVADLREAGRMPALIEQAIGRLENLDILVADFPLRADAPIAEPGEALERLLEARAELILSVSRAALPALKTSPAGRIINIGFLRSMFAAEGAEAFSAAERHLAALTRALAVETGQFGITANYVQPGAVMTDTSREAFRKDKKLRDWCIAHSAARRLGEPVDVAKVVLFLASDDAVFVSGTGIAVDGGRID